MKFTKMHGLGNDYIYVYSKTEPENPSALSRSLSNRHFGIGSDGMIWILPSEIADFKMRIFNADGSEGKMCGNGIRCLGKYVYDKGYTDKKIITVETLSGIKELELSVENGLVSFVSVDMGRGIVSEKTELKVLGERIAFVPVDMGNPHAVIFVPNAENAPVETLGPTIEKNRFFPEGTNVEFVTVLDKYNVRLRVWERGSGITMACGTGSCAAVAAAVKSGLLDFNEDISVHLDGGVLHIVISPDFQVKMIGPAETVFEGETVLC